MKIEEAAKILKMRKQELRLAIQQHLFPFAVAIRNKKGRYTYHIFDDQLRRYMELGK